MNSLEALKKAHKLRELRGKPREALRILKKAEREVYDPYVKLLITTRLAHLSIDVGDTRQAKAYFKRALTMTQVVDADIVRKYVYLLWKVKREPGRVFGMLRKALRGVERIPGNKETLFVKANLWATVGNFRFDLGKYKEALGAYRKALEYALRSGYRERQATVWGDIGNVYCLQKQHKKAIAALEQALILARKYHRHAEPSALLRLGRVYAETGDYLNAKKYLKESLKVAMRGKWKREIGDSHGALGRLALKENDRKAAERHFRAALKFYRELEFAPLIRETRKALSRSV